MCSYGLETSNVPPPKYFAYPTKAVVGQVSVVERGVPREAVVVCEWSVVVGAGAELAGS